MQAIKLRDGCYVDVVFSSDDEEEYGKGWYLTKYDFEAKKTTSSIKHFSTERLAIEALRNDLVRWKR